MTGLKSFYKWLEPGIIALIISLMIVLQLLAAVPSEAEEVACTTHHVVQADDHLSVLADHYYGDPALASRIASATNQKHITDSAFATISDSNQLNVGDKLCISD
jgi:nucleoid-associated protein YgaU